MRATTAESAAQKAAAVKTLSEQLAALKAELAKAQADQKAVEDAAAAKAKAVADAQEAEKNQTQVREQFERYFAKGHAAVGFEFDEQQSSYVLEPYED